MSREDEARRDLERLEREREKLFHATPPSTGDDDDNDPHVRLGKRIARILGPVILLGLLVYVFATQWP